MIDAVLFCVLPASAKQPAYDFCNHMPSNLISGAGGMACHAMLWQWVAISAACAGSCGPSGISVPGSALYVPCTARYGTRARGSKTPKAVNGLWVAVSQADPVSVGIRCDSGVHYVPTTDGCSGRAGLLDVCRLAGYGLPMMGVAVLTTS